MFDSNLARYYRDYRMLYGYFKADEPVAIAAQLVKSNTVEIQDASEAWHEAATVTDNFQRVRRHHWKPAEAAAVRLTVQETRGNTDVLVFGFDILGEA